MTCYVDAEQLEHLGLLSARTGTPVAELVREGVALVLAFHARAPERAQADLAAGARRRADRARKA